MALAMDRSSTSSSKELSGDHHQDRPPSIGAWSFRGTTASRTRSSSSTSVSPSSSSNTSWRRNARGWLPTTCKTGLSFGSSRNRRRRARRHGSASRSSSTCAMGLRSDRPPCSSFCRAAAPGRWRTTRKGFQALLPRAGRLDEAQRVQLFTGGLLPPLSLQVEQQKPPSLAAAMSLARQFELMDLFPAKASTQGVLSAPGQRLAHT
jgi:hypothetical protein